MPAVSRKQANLMRAAEHGATFPMAQKVRSSMTRSALHEFASMGPAKPRKNNLGVYQHPKKAR